MINILITSAGKRVDLIKEFKKQAKVIITDVTDFNAGKFFSDKFYKAPEVIAKNYISFLKRIITKEKIKLLLSVIDTDLPLLAKHKQEFEKLGCIILISPPQSIAVTYNKFKTTEFLKKINILTPKLYKPNEIKRFPVFLKPAEGSGSKNIYKINNGKELKFYYPIIPKPMIMEFISGQEYTIDLLCDFNGRVINIIPRKRIEITNGISTKAIVDMDKSIIDDVVKIAANLKIIGPAVMQCIKNEKNYFIELNLRFGGGTILGIKSGGDYITKIVKMLQGKKYDFDNKVIKNHCKMVAYLEHKFEYHD